MKQSIIKHKIVHYFEEFQKYSIKDKIMKIVICDDDREMLNQIEVYCEQICEKEDVIISYNNSEELYEYLSKEQPQVELFILDIEMPGLDGLEMKKQISTMYKYTNILFLTSHSEMMQKAFGRNVMGFLQKNNYRELLASSIREIRKEVQKDDMLEVIINGESVSFHKSMIIMIEAKHVYSIVSYVNYFNQEEQKIEFEQNSYRLSLSKWEQILPSCDFCKISRSCIVNMKYVKKIGDYIVLENGEMIEIPVKKKKHIKQVYNEYCLRMAKVVY